jgi:capsular polysaccharide biosynthesis protein
MSHCYESFVAEIRNVRILGPHALALTESNEVVLEQRANKSLRGGVLDAPLRSTLFYSGPLKTLKHFLDRNSSEFSFDNVASLLTGRAIKARPPAYGHWLMEILPRLRGINHYTAVTGIKPKLLVYDDISDWQINSLEVLGYSEDNLIRWKNGQAIIDRYIVPKWPKNEWCEGDISWICSQFEMNLDYERHLQKFSSYIYLSREHIEKRRVSNRTDLMNILSAKGFQSVCPELLSLEEQVALFKGASVVIGPAGSAFNNMIFADETIIIELFGEYFHAWNWELAQILDMEYYALFGESVNSDVRKWHRDFVISCSQLDDLLNQLERDGKI